jgi:hypothetical protein
MSLRPVEVPQFRGLDLRDPQEVGPGAAISLSNVDFNPAGVLHGRGGQKLLTSLAAASTGICAWPTPSATYDTFLVTTGTRVYAYTGDGTLSGSTATADNIQDFAAIGTATGVGYYTNNANQIRKITSAGVMTTPGGLPVARFLAVQNPDNRLVAVSPSTSKVQFSDPGAPETFGATNYVDVEPYDSDSTTGLVSWNNLLFLFKRNKIFVFTGNSVDGSGNPIFNYRRVSGKIGAVDPGIGRTAIAAQDGVYFVSADGVYRTTGGAPVKISAALDPAFRNDYTNLYSAVPSGSSMAPFQIAVCGNQLMFQVPFFQFVYNMAQDTWTLWSLTSEPRIVSGRVLESGASLERFVGASAVASNLTFVSRTVNSDYGNAFTCSYRSGFWSPGQPGTESVIREWLLNGYGDISFSTAVNDAVSMGTNATVSMGSGYPTIDQGRDRRAVRCRNVSYQISSAGPLFQVNRLVANLRSQRSSGLQAA